MPPAAAQGGWRRRAPEAPRHVYGPTACKVQHREHGVGVGDGEHPHRRPLPVDNEWVDEQREKNGHNPVGDEAGSLSNTARDDGGRCGEKTEVPEPQDVGVGELEGNVDGDKLVVPLPTCKCAPEKPPRYAADAAVEEVHHENAADVHADAAGLHEGEAGLHHPHQHPARQDPHGVDIRGKGIDINGRSGLNRRV